MCAALTLLGCQGTFSVVDLEAPPDTPGIDAAFGFDGGTGRTDGGPGGDDGGTPGPGTDSGTGTGTDSGTRFDAGPDCTPNCAGRECGGDGCGGLCGSCGGGQMCSGGSCVSIAPVCGNGVVEGDERCDGDCPTSCPDTTCATRTLVGSASSCDARCQSSPVTACTSGDGCCPSGCSLPGDSDCSLDCTNLAAWPADWAEQEEIALDEMNRHRSTGYTCASGPMMSVPPLTMNDEARIAARCHSQDMADNNFFSHTGTVIARFSDRMRAAGYTGSPRNENIAAGNGTGVAANNQWMTSSTGHCDAVMAGTNEDVGIGYIRQSGTRWTHYWTAVYGR